MVGEKKLEGLRSVLAESTESLEEEILDQLNQFSTHIRDSDFEEDDRSIHYPEITDIRIVGLENDECTVVFDVEFESEHKISWEEVIDPSEGYTRSRSDWVRQINTANGTAKLVIDSKTGKIASTKMVEVEGSEIEVQKMPWKYWD